MDYNTSIDMQKRFLFLLFFSFLFLLKLFDDLDSKEEIYMEFYVVLSMHKIINKKQYRRNERSVILNLCYNTNRLDNIFATNGTSSITATTNTISTI